ncbi:MAG: substrate-binding domain-containing protein [Microthrixaceae bacterium]
MTEAGLRGPILRGSSKPQVAGKAAVLLSAILVVGVLCTGVARADGPTVTGTGSSFAALEIEQWKGDVANKYDLTINFQAGGSTQGRLNYLNGTVDFGASDIEYQGEEQRLIDASPRRDFVYVPVSAGPVALMFNVIGTDGRRISDLNISRRDACRIFTEPEISWNDPSIAATNPGLPLPAKKIRPVVRNDGAGTSYVVSEYCIAVAPDVWNAFRQYIAERRPDQNSVPLREGLPVSTWPQGIGNSSGATASSGVAQTVQGSADTVTYVDAAPTIVAPIDGNPAPVMSIQNPAGVFQRPVPAAATVALAYAAARPNGTFQLSYDGADPRAYFPSTYSYVIAQTNGFDPAKGRVLGAFLNYAVTAGQKNVEALEYARLSEVLVNLALDKVQQIPGAPTRPTDLGGAPPPPDVLAGTSAGVGSGGLGGGAGAAGAPGAGGVAGAVAGAVLTPEQAAAAATAAAVAEAQKAANEEAAAADLASAEEIAAGQGGPGNREVLFTLLQGAALVGLGVFLSKGVRTSWQKT